MNGMITEMKKYTGKNQQQSIWGRRTESELEDWMAEITAMDQNKEWKEMRTS